MSCLMDSFWNCQNCCFTIWCDWNATQFYTWQVNGKLVSPTHALANAEVVEIVTYDVRALPLHSLSFSIATYATLVLPQVLLLWADISPVMLCAASTLEDCNDPI